MRIIKTFPHKKASLWQSAAESVTRGTGEVPESARSTPEAPGTAAPSTPPVYRPDVETHLVGGATAIAEHIAGGTAATEAAPAAAAATAGGVAGAAVDCARLAFRLAEARLAGDTAKAEALDAELHFSTCDPRWFEAIEQYLRYFELGSGVIPYRQWNALSDFVIEGRLPEKATIGFIADWGTGMEPAARVLQQVARFQPDLVIHLGDIYYSGTEEEVNDYFLKVCRSTLDLSRTTVYNLSGNHDMYAGGGPYYRLLDILGQPASYFCLRNKDWQFLAMDTGLHDHDPNPLQHEMTFLEPREVEWHRDKIANAGGRKTVLLSHHPLFSLSGKIGPGPVNTRLHDAFADLLPRVALWLWGHEHNLIQYGTFADLARGRCIGCGAIPVFVDVDPYHPRFPQVPVGPPRLGNNGTVYNHGYAIMKLDGPRGTVSYYQATEPPEALWSDLL